MTDPSSATRTDPLIQARWPGRPGAAMLCRSCWWAASSFAAAARS